jgi:hypothetical protein
VTVIVTDARQLFTPPQVKQTVALTLARRLGTTGVAEAMYPGPTVPQTLYILELAVVHSCPEAAAVTRYQPESPGQSVETTVALSQCPAVGAEIRREES